MGLFGDLFDYNNDGKLDSFEKAAEFSFVMSAINALDHDENEDEFDEENDEEW